MKLENFKKLKVGDKIRYEDWNGISTGYIARVHGIYVEVKTITELDVFVTPRQVIAKIVKKKKPKFVGYTVEIKINDYTEYLVSKKLFEGEDTHEVYVRPIKNKGDKNGSK